MDDGPDEDNNKGPVNQSLHLNKDFNSAGYQTARFCLYWVSFHFLRMELSFHGSVNTSCLCIEWSSDMCVFLTAWTECALQSSGLHVPDNSALLPVCDVHVVCEQYGVIRHNRIQRWQNSLWNVLHALQNPIIHQQIVNEKLKTHTHKNTKAMHIQVKKSDVSHEKKVSESTCPHGQL